MLSSSRRALILIAAALTVQGRLSESAPTFHRPSTAEQTFVRGMMAADHQFGLYMTLSETSRGGDSDSIAEDAREQRMNPTTQACEEAMIRARRAAFSFGNTVRREAFRHLPIRDEKKD
mmetsp:Transcript_2251/g.3136  ORF Transcript_2251/g.3136 Transcript_2251/m.3136 type:complete len:119 (-) Transcript_2251:171-527(-)|eukprot:CAMPEP_0201686440 /NCGR_PEP_ID=MMETSP0578-20130828/889_1 /ASSEMBLY_ACC=CAM_ASM_000663 /TAXON_ID=267565 /ORGANISM="Skeletonema grethea, Strain CCMP 1804" /LENGTH=118 /DNA_ID=CAMNT_0048170499 /DNA_START=36 /DNA_END=392 /DNA_ORIENTATION=+